MTFENDNQTRALTREERKAERRRQRLEEEQKEWLDGRKKIRIRLIPIWLRLIIIAVLIVVCLILGAIVGYSVIGDGEANEVFNKSTWTHIIDLITKN